MNLLFAFIGGFLLCYGTMVLPSYFRMRGVSQTEEQTVMVKRTKPSLRNPMKTYSTGYDEYKTKKGLFAPVRPRTETRDEVEVSR